METMKKLEPTAIREEAKRKYVSEYGTAEYVNQTIELFKKFQIDGEFTEIGVKRNVEEWYKNKTNIFNIFREHPYWDENAKAIVFEKDEMRYADFGLATEKLERIISVVGDHYGRIYNDGIYELLTELRRIIDSERVNENQAQYLNSIASKYKIDPHIATLLRANVKFTKIVRKIFSNLEMIDYHSGDSIMVDATQIRGDEFSFEKEFAKFADLMSELVVHRITVISVNFLDFLTMSNGNSWSSCHYINSYGIFHQSDENSYHGMYKRGCLSYALDDCSFIYYTLEDKSSDEEYYLRPKVNRMCCQYKNGILITGKDYPNNTEKHSDEIRHDVQAILAQCEGFDNMWTFSRQISRISEFVKPDPEASNYPDFLYDHQEPRISLRKPFMMSISVNDVDSESVINKFTIGHCTYCVACGEKFDSNDHEWLQCVDHRADHFCRHCGKYFEDPHELVMVDGTAMCRNCCFYCQYHQCFEIGEYKEITINGELVKVCNEGADHVKTCKRCGSYFFSGSDTLYCDNCIRDAVKENGFETLVPGQYRIGDYVLMGTVDMISRCRYTASGTMISEYPLRIARIISASDNGSAINVTINKSDERHWNWDPGCFLGVIKNKHRRLEKLVGKNIFDI